MWRYNSCNNIISQKRPVAQSIPSAPTNPSDKLLSRGLRTARNKAITVYFQQQRQPQLRTGMVMTAMAPVAPGVRGIAGSLSSSRAGIMPLPPRSAASLAPHSSPVAAKRSVFAQAEHQQRSDAMDRQPSGGAAAISLMASRSLSASLELDAPYLEPLLRNFVLGASAGAILELLHVLFTAASSAHSGGSFNLLSSVLPSVQSALSPLWFLDHSVAIGVWALLYIVEATAVDRVLQQHQDKPDVAARMLRSMETLPKLMLPRFSLAALRRQVFTWFFGKRQLAAQAGAAGSSPAAAAAAPAAAAPPVADNSDAGNPAAANVSAFSNGVSRNPSGGLTRTSSTGASRTLSSSSSLGSASSLVDELSRELNERANSLNRSASAGLLDRTEELGRKRSGKYGGSGLRPLRETKEVNKESKRAKELRERKAYLKNFWYAAALSESVKGDTPYEVKMMGRTVVLFRDENGKVRCMENLCPHRGAPLGKGWVQEVEGKKCVVCPYHAWAFDGEGRLKDVPAATKGCLPKRPVVDTYHVEEKGGFVWLFFGSKSMPADERPPIPVIPELSDPNWRAVYGEMEFNAPHWSTFDNALDFAHIHYVHGSSFGNPDKPEILDMNIERDTWCIQGSFKIHNKPVNKLWEWTRVPYVPVEVQAFLPMTSAVKITLGGGVQMITYVNTVPIDEHRSVNRFCLIRNFATHPAADPFVKKEMFKILGEDKDIVETVDPENMPFELSLEPDVPQIMFRRLRQEWVDMGYAVDPKSTIGHSGSLSPQ